MFLTMEIVFFLILKIAREFDVFKFQLKFKNPYRRLYGEYYKFKLQLTTNDVDFTISSAGINDVMKMRIHIAKFIQFMFMPLSSI